MPLSGEALVVMMTFRHIAHFWLGPQGDEMRVRASWPRTLERVSHIGGSGFDQISKANTLVGIVGIFVGLYVYSSVALAEVEEEINKDDEDNYSYSIIELPRGTVANFSVDSIINIDRQPEFISSKDPTRFDEVLIPDAVWGLDASMGAHSNRVSDGFGWETHIISGVDLEMTGYWTNTIVDFRDGKGEYSLLPPPQFQVASCGGASAERSDLEHCNDRDNNSSQGLSNATTRQPDTSTSTTPDTNNTVILSNGDSPSSLNTQSNFPQPAPFVASMVRQLGNLTLQDPCDAAPVSCLTIYTDQPAMQFSSTTTAPALLTVSVPPPGLPIPPIDDLTPPIDPSPPENPPSPISVDFPGPGLDVPVFSLQPQKPIPEIPTWAMTVIGFGIVLFVFGTKRKNRVNPISIVDIAEGY
jgi:hypothetical protein